MLWLFLFSGFPDNFTSEWDKIIFRIKIILRDLSRGFPIGVRHICSRHFRYLPYNLQAHTNVLKTASGLIIKIFSGLLVLYCFIDLFRPIFVKTRLPAGLYKSACINKWPASYNNCWSYCHAPVSGHSPLHRSLSSKAKISFHGVGPPKTIFVL